MNQLIDKEKNGLLVDPKEETDSLDSAARILKPRPKGSSNSHSIIGDDG